MRPYLGMPLFIFIFLLSEISSTFGSEAMQESLYSADDPILQLNYKNFNESIYHKKKAFFIEFYSSWCGHCIAFAPKWKELAKAVVGWKRVVEIAAVNCALDSNFGLCQEHNLEGYPALKYFKYGSTGPNDGALYDGVREGAADMMAAIAGFVSADYEKQKPHGWPDFSLAHDTKPGENLWQHDAHYFVLVFEDLAEESKKGKEHVRYMGAQTVLDFLDTKDVMIRRATSKHQMAKAHDVKHFPGLLIFSRSHKDAPAFVSREALTRSDVMLKIKHNTHLGSKEHGNKLDQGAVTLHSDSERYYVHYGDIISGLSYTFTHEIPMRKRIDGDKFNALRQFLETLTKYFPGPEPMRRLLFRMTSWLNEKSNAITSDEWLTQLKKTQEELGRPLPSNISWVACKGSSPRYRGYPCSMWTLFHTLTVQAYKTDGDKRDFKPLQVLESIRAYLKSFFSCRVCVEHFEISGVHMAGEVSKPGDVVLWLWKAHNKANGFLKGDPSEDPAFLKQPFPPRPLCSSCYRQDGTFDEAGVLQFLLQFYSDIKTPSKSYTYNIMDNSKPANVAEQKSMEMKHPKFREVSWEKLASEERAEKLKEMETRQSFEGESSGRAGGLFNGFDLSLCFLIWFASVALVCMFCVYAKYRRGRHRFWKTFYGDLKV